MFNKIFIGTLSACLIAVIGFYLHSVYRTDTPSLPLATKASVEKSSTVVSASTPIEHQKNNPIEQPDKSLPIPAHQLKKLIAKPSATQNDELSKKMAALDKKLQTIDTQLAESTTSAQSSSTQTPGSTVNAVQDSGDQTAKRIQNIRRHLEK